MTPDQNSFLIRSGQICCELSPLGASIRRLQLQDSSGRWIDIALSPERFEPGLPEPALAGRTIGPCCGRIRNGEIRFDGYHLSLARNEGNHHLHGGPHGCAFSLWKGICVSSREIRFELFLPDGLDGYPGNRMIRADYLVTDDKLSVRYSAETDRDTFLDLTNHVYWDLSGLFDGSALDQQLEIASETVVLNDVQHLPVSIAKAKNAFGFSHPQSFREMISAYPDDEQLRIGRGYNNAFILDPALQAEKGFSARLCSGRSGITMTLQTDAPALVLYTGGFLGKETRLSTPPGTALPGCAVALEAQYIPDAFHLSGADPVLLRRGTVFTRQICWSFTC